ncbi:hypothetical protein HNV10_01285 [Winogradskyella litoriviva]|uniref:Uncharacterized protein n=1 Tax=Winogradskyella litoriviva TaxID=1220182 RepID=A0ABX2DZX4_9FLAO|nr:hypothetical protein [Winogradskyella litoriviva]NRD21854.1 hypothetical protein [Winogradskyella litoriviva]
MTTLLIYGTLLIGHLSVYFYFRNNFKSCLILSQRKAKKHSHIETKDNLNSKNLKNNAVDNKLVLLNKSLRQLEFISEFEMYLEEKTLKNFSLEFLQEFNKIKIEAQLSTLKTADMITNQVKIAA